jgi:hypothetical protein
MNDAQTPVRQGDRRRARFAYQCVCAVRGRGHAAGYARLAKGLPGMIRKNGLGQAPGVIVGSVIVVLQRCPGLKSMLLRHASEPAAHSLPNERAGKLIDAMPQRSEVSFPRLLPEEPQASRAVAEAINRRRRRLRQPLRQTALPLEILGQHGEHGGDVGALLDQLADFEARIIEVVGRTCDLQLSQSGRPPQVGLNSILFELVKAAGQSASVRKLKFVYDDVGVELRHAPVRVEISDAIRVETPLLDAERTFVPIGPLLAGTRSGEGISYLVGRKQNGLPFELPLDQAAHLLVAGGTGGGKTSLLHCITFGFAFRYSPAQVRIALADHKVFEFQRYRGLPQLWHEIVTDREGFSDLVENLFEELGRRKKLLAQDIRNFPALVTIVDEFSGYDDKSEKLVHLIAEGRAARMYFVLATQHPTADVVPTSIKSNLQTAVVFRTREPSTSRLITGCGDATRLLGRGDCLVRSGGCLTRVQAGWVQETDLRLIDRPW